MIKHILMLYMIVACLFSAVVLAAKPEDCAVEPFCFRVEIHRNGTHKEGMNISWNGKKRRAFTYQDAILEHMNEFYNAGRYSEGDCFAIWVDFPRRGDQPFWMYSAIRNGGIVAPQYNKVEGCE